MVPANSRSRSSCTLEGVRPANAKVKLSGVRFKETLLRYSIILKAVALQSWQHAILQPAACYDHPNVATCSCSSKHFLSINTCNLETLTLCPCVLQLAAWHQIACVSRYSIEDQVILLPIPRAAPVIVPPKERNPV